MVRHDAAATGLCQRNSGAAGDSSFWWLARGHSARGIAGAPYPFTVAQPSRLRVYRASSPRQATGCCPDPQARTPALRLRSFALTVRDIQNFDKRAGFLAFPAVVSRE